jgi:uncharacterized membrane protein
MTLATSQSAAAVRYTVTDLGTLPGYGVSFPYSINEMGQIVGYVLDANFDGSVRERAVLFDPNGTGNDIDLGTLGGQSSAALSINNRCQIVGSAQTDLGPSIWYATIFDPNGTGNNSALPPDGASWQNNDCGQIVGFVLVDPPANHTRRAALFEPDSEPNTITLGTLVAYDESEALSINNNGLIVGIAYNPGLWYPYADARALLFDPTGNGDNIDLGTLPGYQSAIAFSVNNNGRIVGRANNLDMSVFNWNPRAVLFDGTGNGNNIDLGTLPGYDSAEAFSINNKGKTVGRAVISEDFTCRAVLFDRTLGGDNIDLNDCIDPALGCTLTEAISINDNGWIVCWGGKSNSDATAFLLRPLPAGPADVKPDADIDLQDFAVLAAAWKTTPAHPNWNPSCDISDPKDQLINERDLAVFAGSYLMDTP